MRPMQQLSFEQGGMQCAVQQKSKETLKNKRIISWFGGINNDGGWKCECQI